jgi:dTDP-4-amino-4,6-dideoxygalactose transaminase
MAIFHYQPLHRALYWKGRYQQTSLPITDRVSETLLRLPLFYKMTAGDAEYVVEKIDLFFKRADRR